MNNLITNNHIHYLEVMYMIIFFRSKKLSILLLICIFFNIFIPINQIKAQTNNGLTNMYSKSYCVMDGNNGRVLEEKDSNTELSNASTTKILTCILILENCDVNSYATASEAAAMQQEVKLGVKTGEKYKIKDLLYAMMLESYNDCAYVLAEAAAQNVEKFSLLMNEKASEIGCKNSYFVTPNGLDAEYKQNRHHSSANDLCKIMKYCTWDSPKSKEFREITQTLEYNFTLPNQQTITVSNHNKLLMENSNIVSGKTGFTAAAGYCYVGAYEKDGVRFCFCLLACGWPNNKNYKWIDSKKIISYIEEFYKEYKENDVEEIYINSEMYYIGKPDIEKWNSIPEIEYELSNFNRKLLIRNDEEITKELNLKTLKKAEYEGNEEVGNIVYNINGEYFYERKIILKKGMTKWNIKNLFKAIITDYISM